MKIEEVGSMVAFIAACYPAWKAPENTVAAWYMALQGLDGKAVLAAARKHVTTQKWPPSVAELTGGVLAAEGRLVVAHDVMAEVLDAVSRYSYESEATLSPVAREVTHCLGWAYLSNSDNPSALRAQVLKTAEIYCARNNTEAALVAAGLPAGQPRPALPDTKPYDPTIA